MVPFHGAHWWLFLHEGESLPFHSIDTDYFSLRHADADLYPLPIIRDPCPRASYPRGYLRFKRWCRIQSRKLRSRPDSVPATTWCEGALLVRDGSLQEVAEVTSVRPARKADCRTVGDQAGKRGISLLQSFANDLAESSALCIATSLLRVRNALSDSGASERRHRPPAGILPMRNIVRAL